MLRTLSRRVITVSVKRNYSKSNLLVTSTSLTEFRLDALRKIEGLPVFKATQLSDTIVECIRMGDLSLALGLLRMGIEIPNFDANGELVDYYFCELLENSSKEDYSIQIAIESLLTLPRERRSELALQLIIEKICKRADDLAMDKLIPLIQWKKDGALLEKVLIMVYLRSLRQDKILSLLSLAFKNGIVLSKQVWREIFEVLLQPSLTERKTLTENALRGTDRSFKNLQSFLEEMCKTGIPLNSNSIDALQEVISTTIVPLPFIRYLETLAPNSPTQ